VSNPRPASPRQARIGLTALILVLLASAAVGFIAYRLLPHPRYLHAVIATPTQPAPGTTSDTGVQTGEPPVPPPKLPVELPEIRLPGTDGAVHRLTDFKGRPLVVNFWATWCEPCRREIPLLKALRREHAADRLEIVGIAVDYPVDVRKYAQTHGIDYPLLIGDQDGLAAASAFGMDTVLPFSVFADRQGRIVTLKVGELHRDEAELILDRVREVDAGQLSLPVAREQISEGVRRLRTAHAAD
jgi:thiol-disulfide isomerase/thioredoxin